MFFKTLWCGASIALLVGCMTPSDGDSAELGTHQSALSANSPAAALVGDLTGCATECQTLNDTCDPDCSGNAACLQKCRTAVGTCMTGCRGSFKDGVAGLGADPNDPPKGTSCDCIGVEQPVQCPGFFTCTSCCDSAISGGGGVGQFCKCGEDWLNFCPSEQSCNDCCSK